MIALGNTNISSVKLGSADVTKMYLGNTIIYKKSAGTPQIGDYIYKDGTFSSTYNSGKEVAGIMYALGISNLGLTSCVIHPKAFGDGYYGPNQLPDPVYSFETYQEGIEDGGIPGMNTHMSYQESLLASRYSEVGSVWADIWANQTIDPGNLSQFPAFGSLYKLAFFLPGESGPWFKNYYGIPSLWSWQRIYDNSVLIEEKLSECGGDDFYQMYWTCNAQGENGNGDKMQWTANVYPDNFIEYRAMTRNNGYLGYRACTAIPQYKLHG